MDTIAPIQVGAHRAGPYRHEFPTQPELAFQLAHAQARDAVHLPLDCAQLANDLQAAGVWPSFWFSCCPGFTPSGGYWPP